MDEFRVVKSEMPVIEANFDEISAGLQQMLEEYKGLVVTADTLPACKSAQKELAGLRNSIETFRKEKKAEFSAPIKAFEDKCKLLVAEVEKVEAPIKDGIKFFDDARREEKKAVAEELIMNAIAEFSLSERFAPKLTVIDKYLNLTATQKEVKDDLWTRAFAIKTEQDAFESKMATLEVVVSKYKDLGLTLDNYKYQIDMGLDTSAIIMQIENDAQRITEARKPKEETKPIETTPAEEKPQEEAPAVAQQYVVDYEIVGTKEQLQSVSRFLKDFGISYTVTSQREA